MTWAVDEIWRTVWCGVDVTLVESRSSLPKHMHTKSFVRVWGGVGESNVTNLLFALKDTVWEAEIFPCIRHQKVMLCGWGKIHNFFL